MSREQERTGPPRGEELDEAVLDALADGEPKTRGQLEQETDAATANVASSLRRLSIEERIVPTSVKGKRVYQETQAFEQAHEEAAAKDPAAIETDKPDEADKLEAGEEASDS